MKVGRAETTDRHVLRELYHALMAARRYVEQAADPLYFGEPSSRQPVAAEVLERVDGALADAGEVLHAERDARR